MEARVCYNFKTAKAIILAKTILESPHKVLEGLWKRTLNDPYIFQKPFNFIVVLACE